MLQIRLRLPESNVPIKALCLLFLLALPLHFAGAQGTVPTFQYTAGQGTYTIVGHDPA